MSCLASVTLFALPAAAGEDVTAEWRDLHLRCQAAVEGAEMLDISGLEDRNPTLIADIVDEAPFGLRIDFDVLRTSARTIPTGIWASPDGRFEVTLLEFTTRPGTRALCETRVARDAAPLTPAEADAILTEVRRMEAEAIADGTHEAADFEARSGVTRIGMTRTGPNPRGCPVVVSATFDPARDYFRTSTAERAGVPACGGPSLAKGGLTSPPSALTPRSAP